MVAPSFLRQSSPLRWWTPATHLPVEPMPSVSHEAGLVPANASQSTLETPMLAADQSVWSTQNAPIIWPVYRRSVRILVLAPVGSMHSVTSEITILSVHVTQVTLEMPYPPARLFHPSTLLRLRMMTPVIPTLVVPTARSVKSMECVSVPAYLPILELHLTADLSVW